MTCCNEYSACDKNPKCCAKPAKVAPIKLGGGNYHPKLAAPKPLPTLDKPSFFARLLATFGISK